MHTTVLAAGSTFTNPLGDGADPWVVYSNGYYYQPIVGGGNAYLIKAKRLQDIAGDKRLWLKVGELPSGLNDTWAPEIHYIDGKWYIYYCANTGDFNQQKMRVMVSANSDIESWYTDGGALNTGNQYAIDGTVFKHNGKLYMAWSGTKTSGISNPTQTYMAEMSSPTQMAVPGARVMISEATQPWEGNVNEGPTYLEKNGKVHMIYSANNFTTGDYALGRLTLTNSNDILNPASWTKAGPIFSRTNDVLGPGHASFVKSPDGTEDWIVYHKKKYQDTYTWDRMIQIQKFTWDGNNNPVFGSPVSPGTVLNEPSGTPDSYLITKNSTAASSSQWSSAFGPMNARNLDIATHSGWASATGENYSWMQIDLGAAYRLSNLEVYSRRNFDQPETRRNLEVWASNHSDMSLGHVVLGTIGSAGYPHNGRWNITVADTTPYRYVAIVKTAANEGTYVEELAVYGKP